MRRIRKPFIVVMMSLTALISSACFGRNFVQPPTASLSTVGAPCNITFSNSSNFPTANGSIALPVTDGTAVPQPLAVISAHNATQVRRLARWGKGIVNDITWSPDSNVIAVTTPYGVYLYDSQNQNLIRFISVEQPEAITASTLSFDHKFLATGLSSRKVQLWGINDGTLDLLVSSSADKLIRIWRIEDGKQILTFQGDKGEIGGVKKIAFSPDGKLLISASSDGTVGLWGIHP